MSVGLNAPSDVHAIDGVRLATAAAGIRYQGRDDLALIEIAPQSTVAAVFTQNKFCEAPVSVAQDHLRKSNPRYLIINAGNAKKEAFEQHGWTSWTVNHASEKLGIPQSNLNRASQLAKNVV